MDYKKQESQMRELCTSLLTEAKVDVVIGFTSDQLDGRAIPYFAREARDVEALKWDDGCSPNLAKYVIEKKEKLALVAKPCDARAIAMYQIEKQLNRTDVYIIGMECPGMKKSDGTLAAGCDGCTVRIPPIYDVLIRADKEQARESPQLLSKQDADKNTSIQNSNTYELNDKLKCFQNEMVKCTLCFACRQACYGCYCKSCFIDRDIPNWLPSDLDISTKMMFHLGRTMHLAGRCVECGACERVCPSGVNIRYLIKELTKLCREEYGYEAGIDVNEIPALSAFSPNDREIGFLGGVEDGSGCGSQKSD